MFVKKSDFVSRYTEQVISELIDGSDTVIADAVNDAESIVKDHLSPLYKIQDELDKTGDQRNRSLKYWVLTIALYFMYERVPDSSVPARVVKNYDDTIDTLLKIGTGKLNCELEQKTTEAGESVSRIRIQSNPPRKYQY